MAIYQPYSTGQLHDHCHLVTHTTLYVVQTGVNTHDYMDFNTMDISVHGALYMTVGRVQCSVFASTYVG